MAGPEVTVLPAGGAPDQGLGTDEGLVRQAIRHADGGDGVVILGDLGSAFLTIKHVLERSSNGGARIADAPLVEGAVAAAVASSAGADIDAVVRSAEEARGAAKL
jgi:PTS hybrid protein